MTNLNRKLVNTLVLSDINLPNGLDEIAAGSYNPMQFVIRLHKDIHKELRNKKNTFEKLQASSTFIHETIHWWQHVGSHLGFLTSLGYPALAHTLHKDLTTLVHRGVKFKSITEYDKKYINNKEKHNNPEIDRILNYYYDVSYANSFLLDNKSIMNISKDRRFFLHMGHCFHILWSSSISALASSLDPKFEFLPKIHKWAPNFKKAEQDQIMGFQIDQGMSIATLGTKAIYEGQARFNQLQYLTIASQNTLTRQDFQSMGMLEGIYSEAYELFLYITEIERPDNFNNSTIGLFLLLCDISINPTDGFPHDIFHYRTFIILNNPGIRFTLLCQVIRNEKEKWSTAVQEYSRTEYVSLTKELCDAINCASPLEGSAKVADWAQDFQSVKDLMIEESQMKFKPENLAIRLFASKYIRFQEDKLKYPGIFCWPGKSMTGEHARELDFTLVENIFNKHHALFMDDENGVIKPTLFEGCEQKNIQETFNTFYTFNTTYEMIMKWVRQPGEFTYDYSWVTADFSESDVKNWIRENFKTSFNIYPEELSIIG
jgi:hypothetical protein